MVGAESRVLGASSRLCKAWYWGALIEAGVYGQGQHMSSANWGHRLGLRLGQAVPIGAGRLQATLGLALVITLALVLTLTLTQTLTFIKSSTFTLITTAST